MSNWDEIGFAPQGWQCPICKRVYSPTTTMCYFCGKPTTTNESSTTGSGLMDYLRDTLMRSMDKEKGGE